MATAEPLGLADIAAKVAFSTEQVARMCAVSRRQLAYWAQKGIIPAEEGYSLATVEKVMLVHRELSKGHTLRRAVQRAEKRLQDRATFEATVVDLPLEQVGVLSAAHLERVESLLLALREVSSRLGSESPGRLTERLAGLRLHEVLGEQTSSLSPCEVLACLNRVIEHLELALDDLREVV
ncbi:MAG: MerR family transcriptional regulator [Chloroflexota bacterium]